jgi:hypothetical protein
MKVLEESEVRRAFLDFIDMLERNYRQYRKELREKLQANVDIKLAELMLLYERLAKVRIVTECEAFKQGLH